MNAAPYTRAHKRTPSAAAAAVRRGGKRHTAGRAGAGVLISEKAVAVVAGRSVGRSVAAKTI